MNENIITIYHNNKAKQYKVLLVIEKDYYYVIYTDLNNYNVHKNLYAVKLISLDKNDILPISDNEWQMIEEEYHKIIN